MPTSEDPLESSLLCPVQMEDYQLYTQRESMAAAMFARGCCHVPGQTQADLVLLEASHIEPLSAGNLWKARDCVGMEVLITDHCISLTTGRINIFNKWFRFHAKSRWILSLKTTYYIPNETPCLPPRYVVDTNTCTSKLTSKSLAPSNWLADHNWSLQ